MAQQTIVLKIQDGWISLDQRLLPESWRNEPIEAVIKSYGILIKPQSLSQQAQGIVKPRLSHQELDELYSQR